MNFREIDFEVILMTNFRSQLKQAVAKMVQECCKWITEGTLSSKDVEVELINTLRTVTEGKIYVEVERARLTHRLAKMKVKQIVSIFKINRFDEFSLNIFQEAEGNVSEAAKIMQELQVETYGSMERREKVELILEQMRLCLATKDYIRAQIISKKISVRFFENTEHHQLKLKFYRYMIEMDENERSYLAICRHYR